VLAGGKKFFFPNGIILSPNEDYLIFSETSKFRLRKLWIKGEKEGKLETLPLSFPCFPDNLAWDSTGENIWVACPSIRRLEWLASQPLLKRMLLNLPKFLRPSMSDGLALLINEEGEVKKYFTGPFYALTSAQEHEGYLYLGTFESDYIARLEI